MLKKLLLISAMFAGGGLMTAHAAPVLSFNPSPQSVSVGQNSFVDIILHGSNTDVLSAYDLSFSYNDAILQDDGSVFDGVNTPPTVDFATNEFSWKESGFSYNLGERGDLILGKIKFLALASGTSDLNFSRVNLTGLTGIEVQNGSISVNGSVPEPTTMLLIGLGALGMASVKYRHSKVIAA